MVQSLLQDKGAPVEIPQGMKDREILNSIKEIGNETKKKDISLVGTDSKLKQDKQGNSKQTETSEFDTIMLPDESVTLRREDEELMNKQSNSTTSTSSSSLSGAPSKAQSYVLWSRGMYSAANEELKKELSIRKQEKEDLEKWFELFFEIDFTTNKQTNKQIAWMKTEIL